jgi:predicted MFS family arabinose efflux permease
MKHLAPVLGACAFASGFGIRIVDPMVPLLSAEFNVSLAATSLLVTAFAFAYAFGQPVLGPLGDAIGKTRLILLCGGIVSVLLILCALAPNFAPLAIARGISGFAAGGIIPLAIAALSDSVDTAERQIALGRFLIASILGQMLGAAASGVVSDLFGWRAVFLLTALLMSTATAIAFYSLPHERRSPAASSGRLSLFHGYAAILSRRRVPWFFATVFVGAVAAYGTFPFVAAILAARLRTGAYEAGLVLGGFGLGGVLYALTVRNVIRVLGPTRMSRIGGLGSGVALALFALPLPWAWNVASFMVLGYCYFMLHNKFQTHATELAPGASGSAVALFAFCIFAAQGAGPLAVGGALSLLPVPVVLALLALLIASVGLAAPRILSRD